MNPEQTVSSAEMERMMKVMVGGSRDHRSLKSNHERWRERNQEHTYDGLYDRRKRRPSPKRVPVEELERVLPLSRLGRFPGRF